VAFVTAHLFPGFIDILGMNKRQTFRRRRHLRPITTALSENDMA
jgi:hypothetical protein